MLQSGTPPPKSEPGLEELESEERESLRKEHMEVPVWHSRLRTLWGRSLLQHRFKPWPGNFHMPRVWQKKKKKERKKRKVYKLEWVICVPSCLALYLNTKSSFAHVISI